MRAAFLVRLSSGVKGIADCQACDDKLPCCTGFWELVADGQEAPFIEGGGEGPQLLKLLRGC